MKKLKIFSFFVMFFLNCFAMEQQPITITTAFTASKECSSGKTKPSSIINNKFCEQGKKEYTNPQIVVWGIGPDGLTNECFKFYNSSIKTQLKSKFKNNFMCFLYDLSVWDLKSWDKKETSFLKQYPDSQRLLQEFGKNAEIIYSSDFFKWLFNLKEETVIYIEKNISCNNSFTWKKSVEYLERKKSSSKFIKDTYLKNIMLFRSLWEKTIDETYSLMQYLEFFYLVQTLIEKGKTDIIFFLPNDELSYYVGKDFENMINLTKDVNKIISLEKPKLQQNTLITLIPFLYGNGKKKPYTKREGDPLKIWENL